MPIFSNILSTLSRAGQTNLKSRSNKNVYLKDSRIAARQFNFGNAGLDSRLPRVKFLYFVNFVSPRPEISKNLNDFGSGISLLVKSFSKPGFSVRTETLNQYNKKRVVQSSVEYDTMNITFYNTYDKKVIDTINDYMQFYYGDFKAKNSSAWNNDIIAPLFQYVFGDGPQNGTDWGFNFPPLISQNPNRKSFDASNSYYFSEINLFQFGASYVDKFTFVNPKISKVNFDTEDYSDSNADTITITFMFEGMIMREKFSEKSNKRLSSQEAELFGFNYSEFNNVEFPCYNNNIELANKKYQNFSNNNVIAIKQNLKTETSQNIQNNSSSRSSLSGKLSPAWFDNILQSKNNSTTSSTGFNMYTVFNPNSEKTKGDLNPFNFFS